MYNQKDILAALQNGEDPQAIANAFADALNAAVKEKAEADKKAAEATKAAERKVTCMEHMLNDLIDFLEEFYPEIYDPELRNHIPAAELVKAMDEARDEVVKVMPVFDDLQKLLDSLEAEHPELKRDYKSCRVVKKTSIDPIDAFLKANGLKM